MKIAEGEGAEGERAKIPLSKLNTGFGFVLGRDGMGSDGLGATAERLNWDTTKLRGQGQPLAIC
jgi:hypothetical protein